MIRVVRSDPLSLNPEAVLRSVSSDLAPDTSFSRDLELKAGPGMTGRLQAMGELPVGAAVITPAGDLPFAFLIHAVLQSAEEPVRIRAVTLALQNGLRRAQEWGLDTVALPPLGAGAGNLDPEEAASVMAPLIVQHMEANEFPREVTIVVGTDYEEEVFRQAIDRASGPAREPTV